MAGEFGLHNCADPIQDYEKGTETTKTVHKHEEYKDNPKVRAEDRFIVLKVGKII